MKKTTAGGAFSLRRPPYERKMEMNKILLAAAVVLGVTASVFAADGDCGPVVSEPLPIAGSVCPAPVEVPAVCAAPVAPVCPAPATPAPVCAASSEPEVYYEVPVQKKIFVDEAYTVEVKRTKVEKEVRTKLIKPNSPRLARVATGNRMDMRIHKDVHREKRYLKPVKVTYTEPVTKTRKIPVVVEETTLVPATKMRGRR